MQAILTWLGQMGFQAVRRMPGGVFPELTGAVVAVSVEKAEAKDAGLYSYLGVLQTDGKRTALYGKRLEAEVLLEVVSPEALGAAACMQAADALLTKLSGGVKGLTITKFSAQECRYVQDGDCFCCKVGAQVQAYLYALANEEETEFTEFILKGEVQ